MIGAAQIAELKAAAEAGLREDAPQPSALARERLLQLYRDCHAVSGRLDLQCSDRKGRWEAGDLDGLEWICRLAHAGHVGAVRLLDRALPLEGGGTQFDHVLPPWPTPTGDRIAALARQFPRVAQFLVMREARLGDLDMTVLLATLDLGGAAYAGIAKALREAYPDGKFPSVPELAMVRSRIERAGDEPASQAGAERRWQAEVFEAIALTRLAARTDDYSQGAWEWLARAADLGSKSARDALWTRRLSQAADRDDFLRDWLATQRDPSQAGNNEGMTVGLALEEGQAGFSPDRDAALPWYAAALNLGDVSASSGLEGRHCYAIAHALERRHPDVAFAMGWYERGFELGHLQCLERWLELGAQERLFPADVALDRARRFVQSRGNAPIQVVDLVLVNDPKKFIAGMDADPAAAAKWLEALAVLGNVPAQYLVGEAYATGRGVEPDPALAREWLHKAAAAGHLFAKADLGEELTQIEQAVVTMKRGGDLEAARKVLRRATNGTKDEQAAISRALRHTR